MGARVRQFTIDAGSYQLIEKLTPHGKQLLSAGLHDFDKALSGRFGSTEFTIPGECLPSDTRVRNMHFELHPQAVSNNKVVVTVNFLSGILWRRGSLRIPNVTIPVATKSAVKGKTVGEIVEGAPFPEFIIRNVIEDKSANGSKLRIRCTGDEQIEVPRI